MRKLTIVLIGFLLVGCGSTPQQPTPTAPAAFTATAVPSPTAVSTFTPLPPTATSTPTITPTPRLPVSMGTPWPNANLAISADNLEQVVELARWGKGVITDAVYSPDGKLIAVASTLGISLYQSETMEESLYIETASRVNSVAFSPDGASLAAGLADNSVQLWKSSDGSLLQTFTKPVKDKEGIKTPAPIKHEITSVAFSPDGSQLASGSTDTTTDLWVIADGSLGRTFKGPTDDVSAVFFAPDGQALFIGSLDGLVRQVQVSDGKVVRTFSGGHEIVAANLSADGKTLAAYDDASYSVGGNLMLWNVEDGKKIKTIKGREAYSDNNITSLAFSPDGQNVAAAWKGYSVMIWNVPGGVLQSTLEDLQPKNGTYYYSDFSIAFSPDSKSLLLAGSNLMGTWDVNKATLLKSAVVKSGPFFNTGLSPDGQTLASLEGANAYFWQFQEGKSVTLKDQIQGRDIAFSPDGSSVLTSLFDSTARIWPLTDQGARRSFEMEKKEYVWGAAYSPEGKTVALATGFPVGKIELRQVSDGALLFTLSLATWGFDRMAFSPNGEFLAASHDNKVMLFRVADGKFVKSFTGGFSVAFSPDSTLLASGAYDKTIRVWEIPTGKISQTIKDLPDSGETVIFSPDGTLLVTGTGDGTIAVYRASDGLLLKTWKAHSRWVSDLTFSLDGRLLISCSGDGTIRIWGLKP